MHCIQFPYSFQIQYGTYNIIKLFKNKICSIMNYKRIMTSMIKFLILIILQLKTKIQLLLQYNCKK